MESVKKLVIVLSFDILNFHSKRPVSTTSSRIFRPLKRLLNVLLLN